MPNQIPHDAAHLAEEREIERLRERASADSNAQQLAKLKARDNATNWWYLAGVWSVIVLTITLGLAAEAAFAAGQLSGWTLAAILVVTTCAIGASQHQLGGAVHEGVHSMLFADKRLNELASDWLAAFPIYTSTYQYRVQHLAHHQFVNDPDRDPDISQLRDSNHWLDFPVTHVELVKSLLKQLWLPNLMRYTLTRAKYGSVGHSRNPYVDGSVERDPLPVRVGVLFAVATPFIAAGLTRTPWPVLAVVFIVAAYAATMLYFWRLPEDQFPQTRLQAVISHKTTTLSRMTFLFVVYFALAIYDVTYATTFGFDHYGLYWTLPLFTSFPIFMMLRQWVQHGNADRGRYTNTRIFLAGPLTRYAVLPWGMDYHLPHHAVASVPHFRLKELHELLLTDPKYAAQHVVVENVLGPVNDKTGRPTVLSLLTRQPPAAGHSHVDNAALEYTAVKDADKIAAEAKRSESGS